MKIVNKSFKHRYFKQVLSFYLIVILATPPWIFTPQASASCFETLEHLSKRKAHLESMALEDLEAIPDPRATFLHQYEKGQFNFSSREQIWLEKTQLIERLKKTPQQLITKQPSIFTTPDLTQDHEGFLSLDLLIGDIVQGPLTETLKNLTILYKQFINTICQSNRKDRPNLLAPQASIITQSGKFYSISQEKAFRLCGRDVYGLKCQENTQGSHGVTAWDHVHCKADTSVQMLVGREEMASSLAELLFPGIMVPSTFFMVRLSQRGTHHPEVQTALTKAIVEGETGKLFFARFPHYEEQFDQKFLKTIPIQVTPTIIGNSLEKDAIVDMESFGAHVLFGFLLPPFDATQGNYINEAKTHRLIGIDNDQVRPTAFIKLKNSLARRKDDYRQDDYRQDDSHQNECQQYEHHPEFRSFLLCLPQMKQQVFPLHSTKLQQQDSDLILLTWLTWLKQQERLYSQLLEQGIVPHEVYESNLQLPIRFLQDEGPNLKTRFEALINLLKDNPQRNHWQLLGGLFPDLSEYYQKLLEQTEFDPLETFRKVMHSSEQQASFENICGRSPNSAFPNPGHDDRINQTIFIADFEEKLWEDLDLSKKKNVTSFLQLMRYADRQDLVTLPLLQRAIGEGCDEAIIKWGLDLFSTDELNIRDAEQRTLLYSLLQAKVSPNLLAWALQEKGIDPNIKDVRKWHPLDILLDQALQDIRSGTTQEILFNLLDVLLNGGAHLCSSTLAVRLYTQLLEKAPRYLPLLTNQLALQNQELDWLLSIETAFPGKKTNQKHAAEIMCQGTWLGPRFLSAEIKRQILDEKNQWIPFTSSDASSNHTVSKAEFFIPGSGIPRSLYFKVYPALPGLEKAAGHFTREVTGFEAAPYTELFRINGQPVIASQGIEGERLDYVLENKPELLEQLDPEAIAKLIIVAMLINPEDGKPANYILDSLKRIIGTDNDQCFVKAFIQDTLKKNLWGTIQAVPQVKTILYCLDQMKHPVPASVRTHFINLPFGEIVDKWLRELKRVQDNYHTCFETEAFNLFKNHGCYLGVPFQKGAIAHVLNKFELIKDCLFQNPDIPLIGVLEKVEPLLAKRYRMALNVPGSTVKTRFKMTDQKFYAGGTTLSRSGDILRSMNIHVGSQNLLQSIRQGRQLGPHQAFQEFEAIKQEMERQKKYQLGVLLGDPETLSNLHLEQTRQNILEKLDFSDPQFKLSHQTAILEALRGKQLRFFAFKNGLALTDSLLGQLTLTHLIKVNLRGCGNISSSAVEQLAMQALSLEVLNLADISALTNIGYMQAFNNNALFFNKLNVLNASNCSALKLINIDAPNLQYLWVDSSESLESFRLKTPSLLSIKCQQTLIKEEDLYELLVQSPKLTEIDLTNCCNICRDARKVRKIFLNLTNITELDLRKGYTNDAAAQILATSTTLTSLGLWSCEVGDIGATALAQNTTITYLNLNDNSKIGNVGAIALAKNTTIKTLELGEDGDMSPPKIDIVGIRALALNTTLTNLYLSGTRVGNSGAKALAQNTTIKKLNLNGFILIGKYISDSGAIALAQNTTLEELSLQINRVGNSGAIAFAKNTTLKHLKLGFNKISSQEAIALAQNTTLESLNLHNNLVGNSGAIALAQNTTLKFLKLHNRGLNLTVIGYNHNKIKDEGANALSKNTTLRYLTLKNNPIGNAGKLALDQSKNPRLHNSCEFD